MPDANLFQLETDFEAAFQAILVAAGIENVEKSRETTDTTTPRVEVKFLPGSVSEKFRHSFVVNGKTRFVYTSYFGSQLTCEVITHRTENGSSHKTMLGLVRSEMQMFKLLDSWPEQDAATRHAIADIRETGSQHSVDDENNFDRTAITFSVNHNIRDDAF